MNFRSLDSNYADVSGLHVGSIIINKFSGERSTVRRRHTAEERVGHNDGHGDIDIAAGKHESSLEHYRNAWAAATGA